jgi:hypothetical protein
MQPAEASQQEWDSVLVLENVITFLKSVFIRKYIQEYYRKPNYFSELCKPVVTTSVTVPKKWKIFGPS